MTPANKCGMNHMDLFGNHLKRILSPNNNFDMKTNVLFFILQRKICMHLNVQQEKKILIYQQNNLGKKIISCVAISLLTLGKVNMKVIAIGLCTMKNINIFYQFNMHVLCHNGSDSFTCELEDIPTVLSKERFKSILI